MERAMRVSSLIARELDAVLSNFASLDDGEVATYIPELATADPNLFGLAIASRNGAVYAAGDADDAFTIQSVSKPFVYAMALDEHGLDAVTARLGAEPSGEAFNAISLEPGTGRPDNPMINAGAIVTTSLISAPNPTDRFARIREVLSGFAGHPLDLDESVYRSEWETGDMNRALAWLMRNAGSLHGDVDEALDVYFRQCALLVTARDIAVMAATLANGGVNPVTGEAIVTDQVASQVLAVMATCGMYDASGEWLLRVGLPAKSGVSGAVMAACPGQFGLGLFSPRLDMKGNSVRAVAACRALSDRFDLHLMRRLNRSAHATRHADGDAPGPPMVDQDAARRATIVVRRLEGDVAFADAEALLRSLDDTLDDAEPAVPAFVVLDLTYVTTMCPAAAAMIAALGRELAASGFTLVTTGAEAGRIPDARDFPSLDEALRWCDDAP
jgi:glutaminase